MTVGHRDGIADMETPKLIFETKDTRGYFFDHGSDFVVLSFSPLGFYGDSPTSRIWGQQLFQKNQISAIGLTARWPHWFPDVDTTKYSEELVHLIRALGRPCLAYGHSMGAYAALKHGRRFGVDAALAFSPQSSINPADVGNFDQRFITAFNKTIHSDMIILQSDPCPVNLVVFDPTCHEDRLHWSKISNFPNASGVVARGTQHMTIDLIQRSEVAHAMFRIALSPNIDRTKALRRLLRDQRRKTPSYWLNTFVELGKHQKFDWANTIQNTLRQQGFTMVRMQIESARQALRNRKSTDAIEILKEIALDDSIKLSELIEIRQTYADLDNISSALNIASEIAKRFPEHTDSWLILAFYHLRMGHKPFAQAAMLRALEGESQEPAFWRRLSDAFLIVGLPQKSFIAAEKARHIDSSRLTIPPM